jgi:hypothetical protein
MKTVLSILTAVMLAGTCWAGNVGTTSEWGIVIATCAYCGTTNGTIEVHHIYPQHIAPDKKYDTNNMVCLCRTDGKGCHFYIGHHGIRWDYVFTNVMQVIEASKK